MTNRSVWRNTDDTHVFQCGIARCLEYDPYGNLTKIIDPKGGETTFAYDGVYHKFLISSTNALNHPITTDWDPLCETSTFVTNANGQTSTTTYDELCRHERTDGPLGTFVEMEYLDLGDPSLQRTKVDRPSPTGQGVHWAYTRFDGLGRSIETRRSGPAAEQTIISDEITFNARGSVESVSLPRFQGDTVYEITFAYDERNRWVTKTIPNPDGAQETIEYGLREVSTFNPEGDRKTTRVSENGLLTYLDEYLGTSAITTTTEVDPPSRTQTVVDHSGNTWVTYFNSLGQVLQVDDPDAGTEIREYNDSGELIRVTNALGEVTEFTYDLLGRMASKTTRVGMPEEDVTTFNYDEDWGAGYFNMGFLTSILDSAGQSGKGYDELGRPKTETRTIGVEQYTKSYGYNAADVLTSIQFPDAQTIYRAYDGAGNLYSETGTIASAQYNAAGQATGEQYDNEVLTTRTYSPTRGWLTDVHSEKSGVIYQDLTYTYHIDGIVETVTSENTMESWEYTYDDLNRLTNATNLDTPSLSQSFQYNSIGNITYNSQIGNYHYPLFGSRPHAVQRIGPIWAPTRTYEYNAAGQMTNRNGTLIQWNGDGKPSSIGNVGFTYDGLGNRLKKVSGGETTLYPFPDYEIAPDGTPIKYLAGGKQVGTEFFIYHRDHLGSIQAITDSGANEVLSKKYKPFGDTHTTLGSHPDLKGWIGEREEETELVYLNARYYDPEIGRFVSPDPLAQLGQGLNRYTYSFNSPITFSDPSGLFGCEDTCGWLGDGPAYELCVNVCEFTADGLRPTAPNRGEERRDDLCARFSCLRQCGGPGCTSEEEPPPPPEPPPPQPPKPPLPPQPRPPEPQPTGFPADTHVDLRGRNLPVAFDPRLSAELQQFAMRQLSASTDLINRSVLGPEAEYILGTLPAIKVVDVGSYQGALVLRQYFALGIWHMQRSSVEYLASSIAHDSYHFYQASLGERHRATPYDKTPEQKAIFYQIIFGRQIGLSAREMMHLMDLIVHPEKIPTESWR